MKFSSNGEREDTYSENKFSDTEGKKKMLKLRINMMQTSSVMDDEKDVEEEVVDMNG